MDFKKSFLVLFSSSFISLSGFAFDLVNPDQAPLNSSQAQLGMFPNTTVTEGDFYSIPDEVQVVIDKADPHFNDLNNMCHPDYTKRIRSVTEDDAKEVFNLYSSEFPNQWEQKGKYEVDHFLSLEIGGSNCIKAGDILPELVTTAEGKSVVVIPAHTCKSGNLWPQPYNPSVNDDIPGARLKDQVEDELKRLVCGGAMDIHDAQGAFIGHNPITGKILTIAGKTISNWYDFFYFTMFLPDQQSEKPKYSGWLKTDDKGEKIK